MLEEGIQTLLRTQLLRRLYERSLSLLCKFRLHIAESSGADRILVTLRATPGGTP